MVIDVRDSLIVPFSKNILESKAATPCCQLDVCCDECLFGRAVAFSVPYDKSRRRI
jgi:hypothetical protein